MEKKKHSNAALSIEKRLRIVRTLSGCSTRKQFAQTTMIPLPTLEAWERGKSVLTEKGARRLVRSLSDCGVQCRESWLLRGEGEFPHVEGATGDGATGIPDVSSDLPQNILREVSSFLRFTPLSTIFRVEDDGMLPCYAKGDIVGGVILDISDASSIVNKDAIVEKRDGERKLRRIISGIRPGLYSATCTNLYTECTQITDYNLDLKSCARVVWHRKVC